MKAIYLKPEVEVIEIVTDGQTMQATSVNIGREGTDAGDADSRGGHGFFDDED